MIAEQFWLLSPCKHLVIWCHHVVVFCSCFGTVMVQKVQFFENGFIFEFQNWGTFQKRICSFRALCYFFYEHSGFQKPDPSLFPSAAPFPFEPLSMFRGTCLSFSQNCLLHSNVIAHVPFLSLSGWAEEDHDHDLLRYPCDHLGFHHWGHICLKKVSCHWGGGSGLLSLNTLVFWGLHCLLPGALICLWWGAGIGKE